MFSASLRAGTTTVSDGAAPSGGIRSHSGAAISGTSFDAPHRLIRSPHPQHRPEHPGGILGRRRATHVRSSGAGASTSRSAGAIRAPMKKITAPTANAISVAAIRAQVRPVADYADHLRRRHVAEHVNHKQLSRHRGRPQPRGNGIQRRGIHWSRAEEDQKHRDESDARSHDDAAEEAEHRRRNRQRALSAGTRYSAFGVLRDHT